MGYKVELLPVVRTDLRDAKKWYQLAKPLRYYYGEI